MLPPDPARIVFYDGHCGLCNRVVGWLLRIDRRAKLHYAPLGGETAKRLLPRLPEDLDAIVYWRQGLPLVDTSNAIGTILKEMDWPWRALSAMLWVPRGLRDGAYKLVAARRYRLFGKFEACPLPEPGLRDRFLA
jgi:predicted DCC family thiol-disulfide oxidoreductase YuxK